MPRQMERREASSTLRQGGTDREAAPWKLHPDRDIVFPARTPEHLHRLQHRLLPRMGSDLGDPRRHRTGQDPGLHLRDLLRMGYRMGIRVDRPRPLPAAHEALQLVAFVTGATAFGLVRT